MDLKESHLLYKSLIAHKRPADLNVLNCQRSIMISFVIEVLIYHTVQCQTSQDYKHKHLLTYVQHYRSTFIVESMCQLLWSCSGTNVVIINKQSNTIVD